MPPSREMDVRGRLGRFLQPGDLVMGRRVHRVRVEDAETVELTFDTNDVLHVHANDYVDVDLPGKDATWIRVEPDIDDEERLTGWTLVLVLDSDWQEWSVNAEGGKQEFRVGLSESDLFALAMATSLPVTMQIMVEDGAA